MIWGRETPFHRLRAAGDRPWCPPPLASLLVWSPLGPEDPPGQVQPPAVCFPLRDLSPRASPPASRGGQVSWPWEQAGQERKCKQHIQRPAVSHWPRDMPPAGPKPPVLSHCAVGGGRGSGPTEAGLTQSSLSQAPATATSGPTKERVQWMFAGLFS